MTKNKNILNLINKKNVWWDFDGVIKESLEVKSLGFAKLFGSYNKELVNRIVNHHNFNGGISRYKKIPLYLEWVGEEVNPNKIDAFCKKFSEIVKNEVLSSPWVPGVYSILEENYKSKNYFLLSATPQDEIEYILKKLKLSNFFKVIYGSPTEKVDAIKKTILEYNISIENSIFVGDSESDLKAAANSGVDFLLKKTKCNLSLQNKFKGPKINNFLL